MKTVDMQVKPLTADQYAYAFAHLRATQKADETDPYFRAYLAAELLEHFIPECTVVNLTKFNHAFSRYQIHLKVADIDFVIEEVVADLLSAFIWVFTRDGDDYSEQAIYSLVVFSTVYEKSVSQASSKDELENALLSELRSFVDEISEISEINSFVSL
jgi:hypothetical protein